MTLLERIRELECEQEEFTFGTSNAQQWDYLQEQIEELVYKLDPCDAYLYFSQYKG